MTEKEAMDSTKNQTETSTKVQPKDADLGSYHDLSDNAKISDSDIDNALKSWQEYAPKEFQGLLNAEVEKDV